MRVLIADKFEKSGQDRLIAAGCEVSCQLGLKDEALAREVERFQPDVLIVRSTKVTEQILSAGPLKLIVRAGAGYNTIDVAAASRRGIYVSNCPGKNSVAVAELAFGLMLALDRRIADNVIALRAGQWNKAEFSKARGLFGRTLGLIGVGQIGREMIPRARAFGMPVVAWSRSLAPERAEELGIVHRDSPEDVAVAADIVSVHIALNADTRGLIGASVLRRHAAGRLLHQHLARRSGGSGGARSGRSRRMEFAPGLDVFAQEPGGGTGEFSDAVSKLSNVYGTHHIGASTDQAQEAIAAETVRIVRTFKDSGKVPNVVNLAKTTPATCALVVRHLDRPGVLAGVLDAISGARINVQEMENMVFEGAEAAVARIHLETEPAPELLDKMRAANADVIELSLIRLSQ